VNSNTLSCELHKEPKYMLQFNGIKPLHAQRQSAVRFTGNHVRSNPAEIRVIRACWECWLAGKAGMGWGGIERVNFCDPRFLRPSFILGGALWSDLRLLGLGVFLYRGDGVGHVFGLFAQLPVGHASRRFVLRRMESG
jgi:hypothetical protein